MALMERLRQASSYVRRLRLSLGPDSYSQYKRERTSEREQADRARKHAEDAARGDLERSEREREYAERYAREREGDARRESPEH
jgi:hypothetical protein